MRVRIAEEDPKAELFLPSSKPDGSDVGVNYADAYVKVFKVTLADGRKVSCKRRGLKLTLKLGDGQGAGLLRRLEHGPDVKALLRKALEEAARDAGAELVVEAGVIYLDLPKSP